MTTIREHLEAIRDEAYPSSSFISERRRLKKAGEHAVAALNLLDEGELVGLDETEMVSFRLVSDLVPEMPA